MSPQKPLIDPKHCDACTELLQSTAVTQDLIDRCKACGLDVSEYQAQLDGQRAMASAIKTNFFPSPPSQ
jgi:hypothetical protein